MRTWSTILVLVAACGFPRPADIPDPGAADARVPPADASLCYGSFVRVCFDSAADLPTHPRHFGDDGHPVLINTDVASLCDQHNDRKSAYCVITGAGMAFAQTTSFYAQGSKALVLLSTATVDLRGAIDVSGFLGSAAGAVPMGGCAEGAAVQGSSGGAGGSFGGRGGNGGVVNAPAGSSAAAPALTAFPATLRGGCAGQAGDMFGIPASPGGGGGGAVAIIAPSLVLDGVINASGQGGSGGAASAGEGGGGGGSGGMIVLDIPMTGISLGSNGKLFANGGGGGEGGDGFSTGAPGMTPFRPTPAASGGGTGVSGPGNLAGGKGGDGSAGAELGGSTSPGGVQGSGGGGGGGGGAGFIHAPGIVGDVVISPPSRDLP